MRTMQLLRGARSNSAATDAIALARTRGWTDAAIAKHGSKLVKRSLKQVAPVARVAPRPERTVAEFRTENSTYRYNAAERTITALTGKYAGQVFDLAPDATPQIEVGQRAYASVQDPGGSGEYVTLSTSPVREIMGTLPRVEPKPFVPRESWPGSVHVQGGGEYAVEYTIVDKFRAAENKLVYDLAVTERGSHVGVVRVLAGEFMQVVMGDRRKLESTLNGARVDLYASF